MTITYQDSFSNTANQTSYTHSSVDIGAPATNRVVYALIGSRASQTSASTITSVTIGGIAASEITQGQDAVGTSGRNVIGVFAAVVPTGTTADVVVVHNREQVRSGGFVRVSYDAVPETSFVSIDEYATGPSVTQSRSDGGTFAFQSTHATSDTTPTGGTLDGEISIESILKLSTFDVTADTFSTLSGANGFATLLVVVTFPEQRLPAIRPHQKTRLHLRDSAQLDFGPERQTLTNSGVTVNDDVFTFESGDYIDPGTPLVDADVDDWTIAAWVKTSQAAKGLIYHETPLSSASTLGVYLRFDDDGTLDCFFNADGSGAYTTVSGTTDVRDGEWHLVTVRKIGTDVEMRLDYDTEVNTATADSTGFDWTSVDTGSIGEDRRTSRSSPFVGDMADIRVFGYGLTAGEVFDLYNEGRNWVLQRRVDQAISIDPSTYAGSGDLLDRSGNGNDATLVGNATVTGGVISTDDDAGTSYVSAPTAGMDKAKGTYSIWWKPDSTTSNWRYWFDNSSGGGGGARITFVQPGHGATVDKIIIASDGRSQTTSSTHVLSAGTWHHLAATWDTTADEFLVYINGQAVSMDAATGTLGGNTLGTDLHIGANNNTSHSLDGDIDKILVANEAYTAEQIAQIYALGREEDTGTAAFDLPERKQLPDTVVHVLDGSTDAGFYGEELTLEETTYENGVYTLSGTTPRIDMGQTRVFNEADGFAFAGWFKPTAVSSRQFLWCHLTVSYVEINTSTAIRYKASDNVLRSWSYTFAAGETYHIAVSNDGAGNAELWVNGTSVGTIVVNGSSTFSFSQISLNNASFEFQGDTWDNRVFDRPITAGEVANLYRKGIPAIRDAEVLRIDPARYSGSGDLIDQTGGGSDATLLGTTSVTNGTIVFNGDSTDRVEATVSGLTKAEGTYAFWFKPNFDSTDTSAYYFCDVATTRIAFFKTSGTNEGIQIYVDGKANTDNGISYSAGEWHHLAATWDEAANEYRIYFDGESTGTAVPNGSLIGNADTGALSLGRAAAGALPFDGEFDKFLACDKALTADQIAFLASSREFADPFPEPFLGLGGEDLNWQLSRYTGSGDILDESGTSNTGDISNLTDTPTPDGITFNGSSDNIDVSSTPMIPATGDWAITADVTIADVANTQTIFCQYLANTANGRLVFYVQSSLIALFLGDDGTLPSNLFSAGSTLVNGTRYRFGVSRTGNVYKLFVDGAEAGSYTDTGTRSILQTGNMVGSRANTSTPYNSATQTDYMSSTLHELRVFTRTVTDEEIAFLTSDGNELPNTRDAKLYFAPSYDDASNGGTSVIDYSGNQNTGTISGGPTWASNTSPDNGHRAIVSTGADNVSFSDDDLPLGDSARSIVTWVRPDDYSNDSQWFEYGSVGTGLRFGLGVRNSDWIVVVVDGGALGTQDTPVAGTWVPVVVTYAGGALDTNTEIWIDGVSRTLSTQAGTTNTTLNTTENLGRLLTSVAGQPVEAALDDVLVFNRVLTPAEIAFFSGKRNPYGTAAASSPATPNPLPLPILLLR